MNKTHSPAALVDVGHVDGNLVHVVEDQAVPLVSPLLLHNEIVANVEEGAAVEVETVTERLRQ